MSVNPDLDVNTERRNRERLRSSIRLFLDACEFWGETFDNGDLITQLQEIADTIQGVEIKDCSEDMVGEIERATMDLISNMDQVLKYLGTSGIRYQGIKH